MKKLLILFISLSTFASCNAQTNDVVKVIDVETFKKGIASENIQLIDVRTLEEFEKGHIKDAVLIDFYKENFKEEMSKLDREKPLYIYCRSGGRSGKASKMLFELGFKEVYDLKGGFLAYEK